MLKVKSLIYNVGDDTALPRPRPRPRLVVLIVDGSDSCSGSRFTDVIVSDTVETTGNDLLTSS